VNRTVARTVGVWLSMRPSTSANALAASLEQCVMLVGYFNTFIYFEIFFVAMQLYCACCPYNDFHILHLGHVSAAFN